MDGGPMLLRDRPENGEPSSCMWCSLERDGHINQRPFNMVLNARMVKSLVEKRCIARGLAASAVYRAPTDAAECCGSRNSLYMGAKCRFVLVACPPKSGIASVGIDCFCILPQTKDNSIQACEGNTLSRICRSILVQEDVLLKAARHLGSIRLPSVA